MPRRKLMSRGAGASRGSQAVEDRLLLEDEMDEFHGQKELVLQDRFKGSSPSADESSESDEEILGLQLSDDEPDNEEVDDGTLLRAWGQTKDSFYDRKETLDDSSASEEAEFEEKEAIALQARLTAALSDRDYEAPVAMETQSIISNEAVGPEVAQDLEPLSAETVLSLLSKSSPEVFEFLEGFQHSLSHVMRNILPSIEVVRTQSGAFTELEKQLLEGNLHLHLCYCVNIMFYLLIKSSRGTTSTHPVIGTLYRLRQMLGYLSQLKVPQDVQLMVRAEASRDHMYSEENTPQRGEIPERVGPSLRPLEYYEHIKMKKQALKKSSKTVQPSLSQETHGAEDTNKRAITYQMARNKGMMPKRHRQQRNPRVKHRNKFQKAIIKRKSQVLPVTTELFKYDGEATGIRSHLTRSVKIM